MKTIEIEVTYNSNVDILDYPVVVKVELSDEDIKRIKKATNFIADDNQTEVRIATYGNFELLDSEGDECDFRVGYSCLCVRGKGEVYFYAQNKHDCGIYFESDFFYPLDNLTDKN